MNPNPQRPPARDFDREFMQAEQEELARHNAMGEYAVKAGYVKPADEPPPALNPDGSYATAGSEGDVQDEHGRPVPKAPAGPPPVS